MDNSKTFVPITGTRAIMSFQDNLTNVVTTTILPGSNMPSIGSPSFGVPLANFVIPVQNILNVGVGGTGVFTI
jgi:hypothetical protein